MRPLIIATLLVATTAAAGAQTSVGLGAGLSVPTGTLANIDDAGYHVLATIQSVQPLSPFAFRTDVSFTSLQRSATIQHISDRLVAVTAGPMIHSPTSSPNFPFVVAGLGVYNQSTSPAPIGSTSSTDVGITVGLGARFAAFGRRAFAEARYHHVLADGGARFVPLTFGLLF